MVSQSYLRMNVRSIGCHFKVERGEREQLFFIGRTENGNSDFFEVQDGCIDLVSKDIGVVDEVIPCRVEGKVRCVLLRKGGEFYVFKESGLGRKLIQINF